HRPPRGRYEHAGHESLGDAGGPREAGYGPANGRFVKVLQEQSMKSFASILLLAVASHAEVRYNRDIRPIMGDTCFRCHGPDKNARMAGMRLDIRDEALKTTASGATPIIPGDPEKSAIVQRVFAAAPRTMPPPYIHKELTAAQKQLIRQWVAEG